MTSSINVKWDSLPDALREMDVYTMDAKGNPIPDTRDIMPVPSAVNESYVVHPDEELAIQHQPTGTLFVGAQTALIRLSNEIDPFDDLYADIVVLNTAAAGGAVGRTVGLTTTSLLLGTPVVAGAGTWTLTLTQLNLTVGPFAFNETGANVAAAINALENGVIPGAVGGGATLAAGTMTLAFPIEMGNIQVRADGIGLVSGAGVVLAVTVTDSVAYVAGGVALLAPTPLLMDYVELKVGGQTRNQITGKAMWEKMRRENSFDRTYSDLHVHGFDLQNNMFTNWVRPASALGTHLYFPLRYIFGPKSQLYPSKYPKSKIEIIIHFRTDGNVYVLGTGTVAPGSISVSSMRVFCCHNQMPDTLRFDIQNETLNNPTIVRYIAYQDIDVANLAIGSGVALDGTFKGNMGDVMACHFELIPSAYANAGRCDEDINSVLLANIIIYDGKHNSLTGSPTGITMAQMRNKSLPARYPGITYRALTLFNMMSWNPSAKPVETMETGALYGYYRLKGDETVRYTPGATSATTHRLIAHMEYARAWEIQPVGSIKDV